MMNDKAHGKYICKNMVYKGSSERVYYQLHLIHCHICRLTFHQK
jgi:hypothetical protein